MSANEISRVFGCHDVFAFFGFGGRPPRWPRRISVNVDTEVEAIIQCVGALELAIAGGRSASGRSSAPSGASTRGYLAETDTTPKTSEEQLDQWRTHTRNVWMLKFLQVIAIPRDSFVDPSRKKNWAELGAKVLEEKRKGMGIYLSDHDHDCLTNLRFADDVLLFATSKEQIRKMLCGFKKSTEKVGLRIHPDKTKILSNQSIINSDTKKELEVEDMKIEKLTRNESVNI